jgi:hypothetical protein
MYDSNSPESLNACSFALVEEFNIAYDANITHSRRKFALRKYELKEAVKDDNHGLIQGKQLF